MIELTLLPLGLAITAVSTMVGLGGGVFFVPLLVLAFGIQTQKAIGISLLTMTFTTTLATIAYARQRRINYRVGVLLDVLDVPGAVLGAYLAMLTDSRVLAGLFGLLLLIISIFLIKRPSLRLPLLKRIKYRIFGIPTKTFCLALGASFVSGIVAGMLGAGGGVIDESIMILGLNMPVGIASATSVFGMALTNGAAAALHLNFGNILPNYATPLIIGAICGSQLGPILSKKVKEGALRKILSAVFVLIALRMIFLPIIRR